MSLLTLLSLANVSTSMELDMAMASAAGPGPSVGITIPVRSSVIASLTYAPSIFPPTLVQGDLTVNFRDGSEATYESVLIHDAIRFATAGSVGKFYNEEVRGKWG